MLAGVHVMLLRRVLQRLIVHLALSQRSGVNIPSLSAHGGDASCAFAG